MNMLIKHLPSGQIDNILQKMSDAVHENGQCPCCGEEDMPVDESGNEIESDDVSRASEWREVHDNDCPIALFEAARNGHF
jgi:hypothetical protein